MSTYDLYAEENKPEINRVWETYRLSPPRKSEFKWEDQPWLYIDVDDSGMVAINEMTSWFGTKGDELSHEQNKEIYEYLIEWELASWYTIGYDDKELFATKKLSEEYGVG